MALSYAKEKHDILTIPNIYGGNPIFILTKSLTKIVKKRIIQEVNGYTLCRLEDRNLLFRPKQFPAGEFEIANCKQTIEDILTEEVMQKLDGKQDDHALPGKNFPRWVVKRGG